MRMLSKPEELILLTVWKLRGNAYGVTIRNNIIHETGLDWTVGAIYVPLGRLARWGYLEVTIGESTAERGGKRKKFYNVTNMGIKALELIRRVNQSMWSEVFDFSEKIWEKP